MVCTVSVRWRQTFVGAALLAAVVALGGNFLGSAGIATAEPGSGTWDIEQYDDCIGKLDPVGTPMDIWAVLVKDCCIKSGGVFDESHWKCTAPSGDSQGSRQLPGNIALPSDVADAPAVTQAPPRPIRVPSDIATAPIATQAPECPPDTTCMPSPVP